MAKIPRAAKIQGDAKNVVLVAAALRELLDSLGPLRVFHGFPGQIEQDMFILAARRAQEVLRRLDHGTLHA